MDSSMCAKDVIDQHLIKLDLPTNIQKMLRSSPKPVHRVEKTWTPGPKYIPPNVDSSFKSIQTIARVPNYLCSPSPDAYVKSDQHKSKYALPSIFNKTGRDALPQTTQKVGPGAYNLSKDEPETRDFGQICNTMKPKSRHDQIPSPIDYDSRKAMKSTLKDTNIRLNKSPHVPERINNYPSPLHYKYTRQYGLGGKMKDNLLEFEKKIDHAKIEIWMDKTLKYRELDPLYVFTQKREQQKQQSISQSLSEESQ